MKTFITIIAFLAFSHSSIAQKIKFKKGNVTIDGVECLTYDSSDPNNVMISDLDGKQTIFLKFIRTGIGHNGGLFTKIVFVEQKQSFTSKSYIFTKKLLVKKLINGKVLNDCSFDPSKIERFVMRYDEDIESTLVRH